MAVRMAGDERGVMIFIKRPESREGDYVEFIRSVFEKDLERGEKEDREAFEGALESVLEDGELCYCLILPNGYAYGVGGSVETYGNLPIEGWPGKEATEKSSFIGLNWKYILEYRKLDGTLCERNWGLCSKCFSLDAVMSDTGIHFCKRCGNTWRINKTGEREPV